LNIIQAVHIHIHMLLKPLFGYNTGQAYGEYDAVIFSKLCIHRGIADEHCGNWCWNSGQRRFNAKIFTSNVLFGPIDTFLIS